MVCRGGVSEGGIEESRMVDTCGKMDAAYEEGLPLSSTPLIDKLVPIDKMPASMPSVLSTRPFKILVAVDKMDVA